MNFKESREKVRLKIIEWHKKPEVKQLLSDKRKQLFKERGSIGCFGLKGDRNYSKLPEIRKKISESNIRSESGKKAQIKLAGNRGFDTYIEKRLIKILEQRFSYVIGTDFSIKPYIKTESTFRFPDILIHRCKPECIIEADGERFHKERDTIRDDELTRLGYKILHISGQILTYSSEDEIVSHINMGLTDNFNIRYLMKGGDN